jgi:hypothetical protein
MDHKETVFFQWPSTMSSQGGDILSSISLYAVYLFIFMGWDGGITNTLCWCDKY